MSSTTGFFTRDPLTRSVGRRGSAVDGGGQLHDDEWTAGASVMQIGKQLFGGIVGAAADVDSDPSCAQRGETVSTHVGIGVFERRHHA